ncbi:MAG: hypothetical protein RMM08_06075 [Armatimonadota bacterium]|nr:cytochrome c3 family protein [bacterium]MDW8320912.1 hypothetical protein [Armatimonadota bacterium]
MKSVRQLVLASFTLTSAVAVLLLYGCGGDSAKAPPMSIEETFRTSLHATRAGKATWYSKQNGGFEALTNISISDMKCMKCHPGTKADGSPIDPATYRPGCDDCHSSPGSPVSDATCLKCHSRQAREIALGYSDVHRAKGFRCMSCHTLEDVHGDGKQYASWLDEGAVKVKCETCHKAVANIQVHQVHNNTVDCTACHTQSVISCYNCHLQSEIQADRKRPHGIIRDYMLLLRRKPGGKVHSGTLMTLNYGDKTFVAIAPYRAHTISRNAKKCEDCHDNAAIREYTQTGKITVTRWDGSKIVNTKGVIPVPPDWQTAFRLDFVDYTGDPASPTTDPTKWVFLKTGADGKQMLYAEPLTPQQIEKLSQPYTSP